MDGCEPWNGLSATLLLCDPILHLRFTFSSANQICVGNSSKEGLTSTPQCHRQSHNHHHATTNCLCHPRFPFRVLMSDRGMCVVSFSSTDRVKTFLVAGLIHPSGSHSSALVYRLVANSFTTNKQTIFNGPPLLRWWFQCNSNGASTPRTTRPLDHINRRPKLLLPSNG